MIAKAKVLIVTAWWPTKTKYFEQYSQSIVRLLNTIDVETELFLTTIYAPSKFESNAKALFQAEQWAIECEFTHVLVIDADVVVLGENSLKKIIELNKDVVLPGRGSGTGCVKANEENDDNGVGWGCCLVKTDVLKKCSFLPGMVNEYMWPDRLWFKRLRFAGINIWRYYDVVANTLEASAGVPMPSFQPKRSVR